MSLSESQIEIHEEKKKISEGFSIELRKEKGKKEYQNSKKIFRFIFCNLFWPQNGQLQTRLTQFYNFFFSSDVY